MEVAATCLYSSQPVVPHSPPSQAFASAISSPSSKRRTVNDRAIVCRIVRQSDRSILFGKTSKLLRTRSCEIQRFRSQDNVKRSISASFDDESFFDEEFDKKLQELVLGFSVPGDDNNGETESRDKKGEISGREEDISPIDSSFPSLETMRPFETAEPPWLGIRPEAPEWIESDEIIPSSVERKANSAELPLSLRILKRKKQWQEGFRDAGEFTYCSVKKAFSSMVFIIREIQNYTLQMREFLFYEDLQGIVERVQKEMHASFVWLFQQIFSSTPTLMVYVMILLANFTVYSMGHNAALAAVPPPESYTTAAEMVTMPDIRTESRFDPLSIRSFSVYGKTASVGGSGCGGGKIRPVAGATDGGDGWLEESSNQSCTIVPDGMSSAVANPAVKKREMIPGSEAEREVILWNTIVEEASKMQAQLRDAALDPETVQRFVSPVMAVMEPEDGAEFFRTELVYRHAVSQEPDNALLLSNYALFLYLVVHDHDRAEEYFKRAISIQPPDADSLSRYASFLWLVRKDLEAAEETYLNAIEADPGNTYHAGNYAHFLWNTGGEDTCYPI